MNGKTIKDGLKTFGRAVVRESPKIFTAAAIVGTIGTAVLAVKATPKALILLDGAKEVLGREPTKREAFKVTWRCYIPAAASAVLTIGCIAAGHSIQARRNAQLLAAYGLSETARLLYSQRVRNHLGEQQERMIRNLSVTDIPTSRGKLIPLDDTPEQDICPMDKILPCKDYISNQEFFASQAQIRAAIDEFNEEEMKVYGKSSINVLYSHFHNPNLKEIPGFNMLGWNYEKSGLVEGTITPFLDERGGLYLLLDYVTPPTYEF